MQRLSTLLLPTLLLAPFAAAQKVTEVEPNDTPATAMPILPGQHIAATYTAAAPTDDDWFSFTLAAPGQVHLQASAGGTLSLGLSRDNRIAIYDAGGTTRLAWNDGSVGTMASCGVTLPAGSYTAVVNLKSGAVADYGLDFYVLPVTPIDTVEGPEPNDSTGTPTAFTLGDVIEGELTSAADVDFWQFTLTGRGYVVAATYDDGGVPQLDNLALRFHQETAPGVWTPLGTGVATNAASHRVTTLAHPNLLSAGTYAIAVTAGSATAGSLAWDYVKTGKYSLRTNLVDLQGTSTIPEGPEPNDNTATPAGAFNLGDDLLGSTTGSTGNGIDWYLFAITAPTTIVAMAEGVAPTPLAGSSLRLWDSTGTVSLASASGSSSSHARLVFTIERAGLYFLQISGPTTMVSGDYLLHTGGCPPIYVSSSTRQEPASTNGCIGSNSLRPLLGNLNGETPAFGSTFLTRIERTIPNSFAAAFLGFSNTLALGAIPLPITLDFGLPDSLGNPTPCAARVDPVVWVLVLTDAAGNGEYSFQFPYVTGDIGLKIFQQALCFDPTLNGFGFSVTNDASYVLGDRPF
ncbi:MAG: hypothetical protein JNL08_00075 [Planctomycetes bacterium]|nr:hypothetical protein [Planctomycetota bacterium]